MEAKGKKTKLYKYKNILEKAGVFSSFHRLKIFQYVFEKHNHPTVDMIHSYLLDEIPTLSKTTVYNTLKILVEKGIVREVEYEDNEIRYDYIKEQHGHFKCTKCGKIYDLILSCCRRCTSEEIAGHKIIQCLPYFKGTCKRCLKKEKKKNEKNNKSDVTSGSD